MKRAVVSLISVICVLFSSACYGQDDYDLKVADHSLSFNQIEKEWHNQNIYTVTNSESSDIFGYFLSFSQAYPNDILNMIVVRALGMLDEGIIGDFVMDKKAGFMRGTAFTELTQDVEMCYWNCSNGARIVAVSLAGYEYTYDDEIEGEEVTCDDRGVICVNDLMFYRLNSDEALWHPLTPKAICGRDFEFDKYKVKLPRQGKDIIIADAETDAVRYVLKWNDGRFTVVNK